jgi:hypothetical protein
MSREKPFKKPLPDLMKRQFEDVALFFYVQGITDTLPSVPDSVAIKQFIKKMNVDWDEASATITYQRMKKEWLRY